MATIITNQATLEYRYGNSVSARTVSNVTETVLNAPLGINKTSLTEVYRLGQSITYLISVTNSSNSSTGSVTVTDDLGTFTLSGNEVTPLTYTGPAQLFINGVFNSILAPVVEDDSVSFTIPNIPANGNAQILYLAQVNGFANGAVNSSITNTATADYDCGCPCDEPVSDSHTITAEQFADVRIIKSVCPNPAVCGEELTFVFDIYNYGNIPATEVVLTDTFDPELSNITVYVNGAVIPAEDYDYTDGTLTLPGADSDYEITVPAAQFVLDSETGMVTVTPGHIQVVVRGII